MVPLLQSGRSLTLHRVARGEPSCCSRYKTVTCHDHSSCDFQRSKVTMAAHVELEELCAGLLDVSKCQESPGERSAAASVSRE